MHPDKHALLAPLSQATRTALHRAAADHGVPLDDLMQTVLGRHVPRQPVYAAHLAAVVIDPDVATEARDALTATWPAPEPPPVIVSVQGARLDEGRRADFLRAMTLLGGEPDGFTLPVLLDLAAVALVRVLVAYPWQSPEGTWGEAIAVPADRAASFLAMLEDVTKLPLAS